MPFDYASRMTYNTRCSSNLVKATDTNISRFFQRYLWERLIAVLEWHIPDHWSYDYFTYCLYQYGYVCILKTDRFGVIPQFCGVRGYNIFYEPTHAVVSNPLLDGIKEPIIGRQCTIIRVNADWGGMWDLITYYADLMAAVCSAVGVNLVNSKLAYLLIGNNKATAATLQKMYDHIASGEPAVCMDKSAFNAMDGTPNWTLFDSNVSQHYITDKLLVDLQAIVNMFDTEIGVPNANKQKKERMITDEVNANNTDTCMGTLSRLARMQKGAKQTREIFGIECSVDWRVKPDLGGVNNGTSQPSGSNVTK